MFTTHKVIKKHTNKKSPNIFYKRYWGFQDKQTAKIILNKYQNKSN